VCIEGLLQNVGEANANHPLAAYACDSTGCVEEDKDTWEKFDRPLNSLLQKPPDKLQYLIHVGEKGIIGLCCFLEYFVSHCAVGEQTKFGRC
jgi:hypothetical protein